MKTKQLTLKKYATGREAIEHPENIWKLEEKDLRPLEDDEVLFKNKWLSNDPAQRGWIEASQDPRRLYTSKVPLETPMRASAIAEVIESKSSKLQIGDLIYVSSGWTQYGIMKAENAQKLNFPEGFKPTIAMGVLGGPGLTAWFGLTDAVKITEKDKTLVVSGAAGAVGSVVVQLAKHHFNISKVIAIAGSEDKLKWVKELGADIALNYKSPTFKEDLIAATPDFVDIYFDNVGGWVLDLLLSRMAVRSQIASCGQIAEYNNPFSGRTGLVNFWEVTTMKIKIQGFIVLEYYARFPEARQELVKLVQEGKLKIEDNETIVKTKLEGVPAVWKGLFEGSNRGKLITELEDE